MFSDRIRLLLLPGLLAGGVAVAQDSAMQSAAQFAAEPRTATPDGYVEQQLDWRSYYLNRIDGSRTGVPEDRTPWFRPATATTGGAAS
ncbi:MAG: hypothetical protein KDJ27_07030 [Gammaproteobacteria bacterium]|nr:hypothetical protein [Gammaproteobacteria bacterium]